jgi:NhaA family Na+:H+ antiporter
MNTNNNRLARLLHHEAAPGILLMLAMLFALIVSNSGASWYDAFLTTYARVGIGEWGIEKPLLLWINDGLMAVFFLLVGLELKREVMFGELSSIRKSALPIIAAIGGIAIPSGIYAWINWGDPVAINGWAIPAATDIAFALGILAILGSRVPVSLKILLTSIAVIDDLAAIIIIAIFYTSQLSMMSLGSAAIILGLLFAINRLGVRSMAPYILLGIALWIAVLKSGVHATLAGVALAAFIPTGKGVDDKDGLTYKLEHGLHSWVVFLILPVFAFANAGVPILGLSIADLMKPVPLGIMLGLFVGKQIGVFGAAFLAVKSGLAQLPSGVKWSQVYGLSALCGIGFTMSLFIGSLAFEGAGGPDYAVDDRLGILAGSFLSAILGVFVLRSVCKPGTKKGEPALDGGLLGPHDEERS